MIDRVAADLGRDADRGAGRASSGSCPGCSTARSASAARRAPGRRSCAATAASWTTDKDGILLGLLASEIIAVTGRTPSEHYADLTARFGEPAYARIDAPADPRGEGGAGASCRRSRSPRRSWPASRSPRCSPPRPATARRSAGSRSSTESGWFAARPSGTEDVYKIYAESFQGPEHLERIQEEARGVVSAALSA